MTIQHKTNVIAFCGKAVLILVAYAAALVLAGIAGWFGGELLHDLLH